jgi:hypothetical protein
MVQPQYAQLAPICLLTFNRLSHTKKTIEHLLKNKEASESLLYVFSDGPRHDKDIEKVDEVRRYLKTISGFREVKIFEREQNYGCRKSVIDAVTKIVNEHGRVIVLEDDLVTSPFFLKYMNDGLNLYQDDLKVASIYGYTYNIENLPETFFIKMAGSWGWATWKNRWEKFNPNAEELLSQFEKNPKLAHEFDLEGSIPWGGYVEMLRQQVTGQINSWAICWVASTFLNSMFTLYPRHSLVYNIGWDGSGIHCGNSTSFDVSLSKTPIVVEPIPIESHNAAREKICQFLSKI